MNVPKINTYIPKTNVLKSNSKAKTLNVSNDLQNTNAISFKAKTISEIIERLDVPIIDCFKYSDKDLFDNYRIHKDYLTYGEVDTLKEMTEKAKAKTGKEYGVYVAFYPSALGDRVFAMSEADFKKGFDAMENITNCDP